MVNIEFVKFLEYLFWLTYYMLPVCQLFHRFIIIKSIWIYKIAFVDIRGTFVEIRNLRGRLGDWNCLFNVHGVLAIKGFFEKFYNLEYVNLKISSVFMLKLFQIV